jgi:colicin import membrane protein
MTAYLLNDRNGRNQHFNSMVLLSFLLHALFLSIFLLSPSLPGKKWTFEPVYSVDLVSSQIIAPSGSQARVPMSKELAASTPKQQQLIVKKSEENRSMPLVDRLAPPRNENAGKIDRAIDDMRKRVASSSSSPKPVPQVGQTPAREGSGGTSGGRMQMYYARIWAKIKGQWALPRGILPDQNLETVISIVILKDGTLAGLSFEKTSGNKYFDQSAARAVRKASPFPPLPEWVKEPNMEIGLRFLSTEFR